MKLRNQQTGEIRKAEAREDGIYLCNELTGHWFKYELDMLASGWEYHVEPAEPLIKDEKIRKVVRAWAEANDVSRVSCDSCVAHKKYMLRFSATELFNEPIIELYSASEESLRDDEHYTIAELCGDEKE